MTTTTPSSTRVCALLAAGAISVLVFMLDASSAQETVRAYNEFILYGAGLSVSLVYAQFQAKKRRQQKQCKVEESQQKQPALHEQLFEKLRVGLEQARTGASQLVKDLTPPTTARRTQGQDTPVVPAWAVGACVLFIATFSIALVVAAFRGLAVTQEEATFLDAAPKACGPDGKPLKKGGLSFGSMSWLAIAFSLASGLCTVHPLQSGMTMGF